jgi:acyl-CoA synthetase (AMP-forming)/AMP-acid ligase II
MDPASFIAPLAEHAKGQGDAWALRWRDGGCSWGQLAALVEAKAQTWRDRGLGPGQRVVLRIHHGPSHLIEALALIAAGGVHCPLDSSLPAAQFKAAVQQLNPHWCLVDDARLLNAASSVFIAEPCAITLFLQEVQTAAPLAPVGSAFIRHTSGTTGTSKGVICQPNRRTLFQIEWRRSRRTFSRFLVEHGFHALDLLRVPTSSGLRNTE